jgi:hypothetical protein
MSPQHDERDALRQQLEALEDRLAQREEAIRALGALPKPIPSAEPGPAAPRRRWLWISLVIVSAGVTVSAVAVVMAPRAPVLPGGGSALGPTAPSSTATGRVLSRGYQSATDRAPPVGLVRPDWCARKHDYHGLTSFPPGSRLLDFKQCLGCDCCLPGGRYPSEFAGGPKPEPIPSYYDCVACAAEQLLAREGVTLGGVRSYALGNYSVEDYVANITFDVPVTAVGLQAGLNGVRVTSKPELQTWVTVTLVGYDAADRPVDAAAARIPEWADDERQISRLSNRAFLSVESCAGATLKRAALFVPKANMYAEDIVLARAP